MKRSHHDKHHQSRAPYELEPEQHKEMIKFNDSITQLAFKTIKITLPSKIVELTAIIEVNKALLSFC